MNRLRTNANCPVCNKKRALHTGNIISNKEGSLVVYNKCPHCFSAFLAVISGSKHRGSLVVVETLTDLTYEEALEMPNRKVLSSDAVLEVYQNIESSI